jgi:hypothetical protein
LHLLETSAASVRRRRRTSSPNTAPASSSSQDHPDVAASQGNIASVSAPATRALCAHSHLLGANGRNPAYASGIASCDVCSKHVPVAEAWSCTICRSDWCKECSIIIVFLSTGDAGDRAEGLERRYPGRPHFSCGRVRV